MDEQFFPKAKKRILYLVIVATLMFSCVVPGFPSQQPEPTPTAFQEPLPPILSEVLPLDGSLLGLNEPITFYFSQPMNQATVEAALFGLPPGTLTWSDASTLKFTPSSSYTADTEITVGFLSSAQAANGLSFVEPISLTFYTADMLRAINFLPEPGSRNIDPGAAVAVTFNQPVVPLGIDSDPSAGSGQGSPAAFAIDPAVSGHGEWLSTSTYVFYPDVAMDGGTTYTARLNTNLLSTSEAPMDSAGGQAAWSFEIALPRLVSVEPSTEHTLSLDPVFKLNFNQPMDPTSVQGGFLFIRDGVPVSGEINWGDDNTQMTFEPDGLLDRNAVYWLTLSDQVTALGGARLESEGQFQYFTYGNFSVHGSSPAQGGVKKEIGSVQVHFTSPPKSTENLEEHIQIRPELSNQGIYLNGTTLNISGFYIPESEYTLTISPDLVDKWDQPLGEAFEIDFSTPAAKPKLSVPYWGTIFYVRPDQPYLQVNATNIQRVDMSVAPISLGDFQLLTGPDGYDATQTFTPQAPQIYSQTYQLEPSRSQSINLPLAESGQSMETGFFHTSVTSPQLNQGFGNQDVLVSYAGSDNRPYLVVASYVNLTLKIGAADALLWATDLRTNKPVSAPFTIYDYFGTAVVSDQTDEGGLWLGEIPGQEYPDRTFTAVMGETGQETFGLVQTAWHIGISPREFGISLRPRAPEPMTYMYSDRPIYRPGQTVYFRGAVRQAFNGRYQLPEIASVLLDVQDDRGHVVQTLNLPLSSYGTFNGEYQLPSTAQPGYYSIENDEIDARLSFTVAEYRKPEIELQVAFGEEQTREGEQVRADSEAGYYFGAPAGEVDVSWNLFGRTTYFYIPGYRTGVVNDNWLFPSWAYFGSFGRTLDSGTERTNSDGTLNLVFSDLPDIDAPQILTLELTTQDESGFRVSARDEMTVHPADFYIGLRPDLWIGQSGEEIGFDVITADWNTDPSPSKALQAEFSKVRWERIDPPPENEFGLPQFERIATIVGSSNLSTGSDGGARLSFTPDEPGTYMLDVHGGGARTQTMLWVMGGQNAAWPRQFNDQVQLTADQEEYQPGQTASIFIPNPFGGSTQALVTIERGKVLNAEVLTLGASGSTYSLELTDDHAPNVYIATTLLGPDNQFRQGYTTLEIEPSAQELQVELTASPEINEPRGKMTLQVRVTDNMGRPVQGEFSLSVVDKAVLALADPNSREIIPAFYGRQSLGITTGLSLAVYSGRFVYQPGGLGGGGGDGLVPVREEFPDTAYWNPTFTTDVDGIGKVTVTLPDNLTTWMIETRGLTLDTRVGQATTEVVTTKPLLVRPVTPRFLVAGDHVELAAIVHNNTDKKLKATVNFDAVGFTLDKPGNSTQNVDVPADGRVRVAWWGVADHADEANLVFAVSGKSGGTTLSDAATPSLGSIPIHQYVAPQTFVTSGVLIEGGARQEVISLPRSYAPTGGGLDVEMSPSLAAALLNTLETLPTPSCTCNNEAVLSYFLPNLELYQALKVSGKDDPVLKARLDESLTEGITALVGAQDFDGSWGWISGGKPDPYISSYILFGLGRARAAGFNIPERTFERAHEFLREHTLTYLNLGNTQAWELNRLTFITFALLQTGGFQGEDILLLNDLYDEREQLEPWAQALLALSLEAASPTNERARDLLANLEATAVRTASSANWESDTSSWRNPGTPLYTTAVVVYALAQRDSASPVLIEAVRYLSSIRNPQKLWGSSYENTWVILALTEAMKGFGELQADFSFSANFNGAPLSSGEVSGTEIFTPISASVPLEHLSPDSPNSLTISRESGLGRLYYRASLLLNQPVESVQPLNKGMEIHRAYFDGNCQDECTPLSALELATDSRLSARMTLIVPNDSYYVMLDDHIPAGTEILNQTLKTSQLGDEGIEVQVIYDEEDPFARGWGWWYFNEPQIRDESITWTADYLPAGTYELTYTLIPTHAGAFRVLPAHAWQAFFPDVQGTSAGSVFEIR